MSKFSSFTLNSTISNAVVLVELTEHKEIEDLVFSCPSTNYKVSLDEIGQDGYVIKVSDSVKVILTNINSKINVDLFIVDCFVYGEIHHI